MTEEKYAEMLNLIPPEAIKMLKDEADAARLVESIFGDPTVEPLLSGNESMCHLRLAMVRQTMPRSEGTSDEAETSPSSHEHKCAE